MASLLHPGPARSPPTQPSELLPPLPTLLTQAGAILTQFYRKPRPAPQPPFTLEMEQASPAEGSILLVPSRAGLRSEL